MLPSLRERKRYLAFEIISETPIKDFNVVSKTIWGKALEFLGEFGCSEAGINILSDKYDGKKQRGLMRLNNKSVDKMRATLVLITQMANQNVIVRSRGISGILKKAETKYIAA